VGLAGTYSLTSPAGDASPLREWTLVRAKPSRDTAVCCVCFESPLRLGRGRLGRGALALALALALGLGFGLRRQRLAHQRRGVHQHAPAWKWGFQQGPSQINRGFNRVLQNSTGVSKGSSTIQQGFEQGPSKFNRGLNRVLQTPQAGTLTLTLTLSLTRTVRLGPLARRAAGQWRGEVHRRRLTSLALPDVNHGARLLVKLLTAWRRDTPSAAFLLTFLRSKPAETL
jgi:hypothetical protein